MNYKRLTFENREGQKLSARLDFPIDSEPIAYALFAHCFTCTKNLRAVQNISTALNEEGIAVLRFDFTGLGESEGDFAETNFSSNVEDLVDAAGFLAREYESPKILIGHSLGGAAVLQAAAHLESARAVATIGAPYDPEHVAHIFESAIDEIEYAGEARVSIGGRPFTIKKHFIDDLRAQNVEDTLRNLGRALLIMHSPVDEIVGIENATLIFRAARHPKSFISLDRADHLLTNPEDSRYVGAMIATWARKYIGAPQEERKKRDHGESHIIAHINRSHYRTEILANGHPLVADEPLSAGGTNMGPSPYDLLAAALGACTVITLRMYADRKQWPVKTITAHLSHKKVHAEDCDCEARITRKIDLIGREIEFTGDLDEQQIERLLQIANRCPVHRTLTDGQVEVKTSLREHAPEA